MSRVRTDTTFVDANIRHPRDSSLLGEAIRQLVTKAQLLIARLDLDVVIDDGVVGRLAGLQADLGRWARSRHRDRMDEILVCTDRIADLASVVAAQAGTVLAAARRVLPARGWAPRGTRRAINVLVKVLGCVDRLVHQAVERAQHRPVPAADKQLSLHDSDARPMQKATTKHKGTQSRTPVRSPKTTPAWSLDYQVHIGQPCDADLIVPAVERVTTRVGRTPDAVTADGTYGAEHARDELTRTGVGYAAIKALGNPGPDQAAFEASDEFNDCRRWRAGVEGRVSHLKRDCGWGRTRMSNLPGAQTWLGWGVVRWPPKLRGELRHHWRAKRLAIDRRDGSDASFNEI